MGKKCRGNPFLKRINFMTTFSFNLNVAFLLFPAGRGLEKGSKRENFL